jgi:hypothetical protein
MRKGEKVQIGGVSKEKYEIWSQFERKTEEGDWVQLWEKGGMRYISNKEK